MAFVSDRRGVVLSGALAAAFLVAQQVAGKATRDTLFLIHYSAAALPAAMMAASVVSIASALGVSRLLSARAPRRAMPILLALNAALLLAEFLLISWLPGLAAVVLYVHVAASGATLVSGYWSVVNERFDPWTAKRVVGRLGLGASLGSVAGGLLAWIGAGALPLPAMLLLMAALNVGALATLVRFTGDPAPDASLVGASSLGWLAAPYLRNLALAVALGGVTEAMLDFVFKARVVVDFADGPGMMAFFAAFHTGTGLLAFAVHTLLTRSTLESLGLAGSVAIRPAAVAVASAAAFIDPRLWSVALGRGCHDVLTNSLFRAGYELLYTPLPEAEKRSAKQLVDVAFDRLGGLLGGATAMGAVWLLATPDRALLPLAGALSLAALGLTRRLHRGYVETLGQSLRAGKVRLDPEEVVDSTTRLTLVETQASHPASAIAALPEAAVPRSSDSVPSGIAELCSGETDRVRRVVRRREALGAVHVAHLVPLLARNDLYPDVLRALRHLAPRVTGQLLDALLDPEVDPQVRRRLPRVLKASPTQRAVDGLLLGLGDPNVEVREACALALVAVSRAPGLRLSAEAVFAAARRELEYGPDPALDHVFTLLSLVLEREPLEVAALALRGQDSALKGTALEYLENVLPYELREALRPHVGATTAGRKPRPPQEVLAELRRRVEGLANVRSRVARDGLTPRG